MLDAEVVEVPGEFRNCVSSELRRFFAFAFVTLHFERCYLIVSFGTSVANGRGRIVTSHNQENAMRRSRFRHFCIAASALISLTFVPLIASATTTRVFHASACIVQSGTAAVSSIGQIANTSGTQLVLQCPLISDPTIPLPSATANTMSQLFSNGCISGVTGVSAEVCVVSASSGTQTCNSGGATVPGSCSPGVYPLPAAFPTMSAGDFAYLLIRLNAPISGSFNTFWGYTLSE